MSGRVDPFLDFRFRVELDGLLVGGFTDVSGLEVEVQTEEYEEGGENAFTHVLPTRVQHGTLTLERGVTDSAELWDWMDAASDGPPTFKTGQVFLYDSVGEPVRGWEFRRGYPIRWTGPELAGDGGAVAVESIEIAHHGLDQFDV